MEGNIDLKLTLGSPFAKNPRVLSPVIQLNSVLASSKQLKNQMEGNIDLALTLGLPSAEGPRVPFAPTTQAFGSGPAGKDAETEYSRHLTVDFGKSISATDEATKPLLPADASPLEMKQYCLINVSIYKGKVGGSKKRKNRDSDRPVSPKPEDREIFCTNYNCRISQTPMWRQGPLGPKSLCNACGIKYRRLMLKEQQQEEGAALTHHKDEGARETV